MFFICNLQRFLDILFNFCKWSNFLRWFIKFLQNIAIYFRCTFLCVPSWCPRCTIGERSRVCTYFLKPWELCCDVSSEIFYNFPNIDRLSTLNFHHLLLIDFIKSISKDHQSKNTCFEQTTAFDFVVMYEISL